MGHNYPGPPLWPPHSRTAARAMAVLVHTHDALAHILHGGRTTRLYFRGCCCGCGIQTVPYRHRRRHVYSAGVNRCGGSETTASASQTVRSAMRNACPCTVRVQQVSYTRTMHWLTFFARPYDKIIFSGMMLRLCIVGALNKSDSLSSSLPRCACC